MLYGNNLLSTTYSCLHGKFNSKSVHSKTAFISIAEARRKSRAVPHPLAFPHLLLIFRRVDACPLLLEPVSWVDGVAWLSLRSHRIGLCYSLSLSPSARHLVHLPGTHVSSLKCRFPRSGKHLLSPLYDPLTACKGQCEAPWNTSLAQTGLRKLQLPEPAIRREFLGLRPVSPSPAHFRKWRGHEPKRSLFVTESTFDKVDRGFLPWSENFISFSGSTFAS